MADTFDDLETAESVIAQVRHLLTEAAGVLKDLSAGTDWPTAGAYVVVRSGLRTALDVATSYCRPSCSALGDPARCEVGETCGCPCCEHPIVVPDDPLAEARRQMMASVLDLVGSTGAHVETVGDRRELVIYTGLRVREAGLSGYEPAEEPS